MINTKIIKKLSIKLAAAGTGVLAVTMVVALAAPVFADNNVGDQNQVNVGITGEDSSLTASSTDGSSAENTNNSGSDQNNASDHSNRNINANGSERGSASDHSNSVEIAQSHEASTTANFNGIQQAADAQITSRLSFLEDLYTRIGDTKFLSATEKTTLENEIQSQIANLSTLQNSIVSATSSITLHKDKQSTAESNAYLRLVPRTALLAAIDWRFGFEFRFPK